MQRACDEKLAKEQAEQQRDLLTLLLTTAREDEREQCAKLAEETVRDEWRDGVGWQTVTETVATAIRQARG